MTSSELADLIEERLTLHAASFGRSYREPHLLFREEVPVVLEALRALRTEQPRP